MFILDRILKQVGEGNYRELKVNGVEMLFIRGDLHPHTRNNLQLNDFIVYEVSTDDNTTDTPILNKFGFHVNNFNFCGLFISRTAIDIPESGEIEIDTLEETDFLTTETIHVVTFP